MDGPAGQLIAVGHDLQAVAPLRTAVALRSPGVFFTAAELARFASAVVPLQSTAAGFAAKEALFKALPPAPEPWFWTDAELAHDRHGAPRFRARGALARHLGRRGLRVAVSLSHSGDYVSAVVVVSAVRTVNRTHPTRTGRTAPRVLRRIAARPAGPPR
ncbi:holo-ACP synthase [Streptomyces lonarensis]|uniref:4'-phosphopantetheinyl transferase superfamily protein n=1 Tax=Streptomyces lonarensis TaxID=700599 RepID=A0A7X6CYV1_9ACTN|nr:4'-phosphopantetheinyl transferase superfamily protein [Streptomyces lonarensis]NJQ05088.1 4'-phosphopantetheinyl transferase superfamily protein [Streptomyces lonarensis]